MGQDGHYKGAKVVERGFTDNYLRFRRWNFVIFTGRSSYASNW